MIVFKMAGKSLSNAKQQRDKFLLEFKAACSDLEDEIHPSGARTANVRRIKLKIGLVRFNYDECLGAQSQVYGLEKTSGAEENNWTWVDTNLRKPKNRILEEAEDVLEAMSENDDPEAESKAQLVEEKMNTKLELSCFEATLRDRVNGVKEAYGDTNIWLTNNHDTLTREVEKLDNDLTKQYIVSCKKYLKYVGEPDVGIEVERQQRF